MKVVSDVLHFSYLDKFGLRVTVEAGQALAVLYSEARLYSIRDPVWRVLLSRLLHVYRQHLRVDKESRPQQHT